MNTKQMSMDRISTLPEPIIETILCRLPTKQAVRTSILAREWRYKWTTVPKLQLSHYKQPVLKQTSDLASTRKNMGMRCKSCYDIHQILLLHRGPIHELTLKMPKCYDCNEFDQIIHNLSRNPTVKKLKLLGSDNISWYTIPLIVFSFHNLTDLAICNFNLDHLPIFIGFGSLGSLCLKNVAISPKPLLQLLSNCPSLKSFDLLVTDYDDKCTINELLECLPMIEHLTTWTLVLEWLELDSASLELPTSLIHLKYICFEEICFADGDELAFLFILIKCSPNLEKIMLKIDWDPTLYKEYSYVWEKYADVWLEHLNELEIECFSNSKPEMEFVKFILARSPKLKKVSISSEVSMDQRMKMLEVLLQAPRASPVRIYV